MAVLTAVTNWELASTLLDKLVTALALFGFSLGISFYPS